MSETKCTFSSSIKRIPWRLRLNPPSHLAFHLSPNQHLRTPLRRHQSFCVFLTYLRADDRLKCLAGSPPAIHDERATAGHGCVSPFADSAGETPTPRFSPAEQPYLTKAPAAPAPPFGPAAGSAQRPRLLDCRR